MKYNTIIKRPKKKKNIITLQVFEDVVKKYYNHGLKYAFESNPIIIYLPLYGAIKP